jgi:hypothetical protein
MKEGLVTFPEAREPGNGYAKAGIGPSIPADPIILRHCLTWEVHSLNVFLFLFILVLYRYRNRNRLVSRRGKPFNSFPSSIAASTYNKNGNVETIGKPSAASLRITVDRW